MARSWKHTPIHGFTTALSERKNKKMWHKNLRAKAHCLCIFMKDDPDFCASDFKKEREVFNIYNGMKDGKIYNPMSMSIEEDKKILLKFYTKDGKIRK